MNCTFYKIGVLQDFLMIERSSALIICAGSDLKSLLIPESIPFFRTHCRNAISIGPSATEYEEHVRDISIGLGGKAISCSSYDDLTELVDYFEGLLILKRFDVCAIWLDERDEKSVFFSKQIFDTLSSLDSVVCDWK